MTTQRAIEISKLNIESLQQRMLLWRDLYECLNSGAKPLAIMQHLREKHSSALTQEWKLIATLLLDVEGGDTKPVSNFV